MPKNLEIALLRQGLASPASLILLVFALIFGFHGVASAQDEDIPGAARDRYLREMNVNLAMSAGYLPVSPLNHSTSGRLFAEALNDRAQNGSTEAFSGASADRSVAAAAPAADGGESGLQITAPDPSSPAQYGQDIRNFYRSADTGRWLMMVSMPGWLPNMKGDLTAGGVRSKVDIGLDDMLNMLEDYFDYGAMLNLEARRGRWSIFGDLVYLRMSGDFDGEATLPPLTIGDRNLGGVRPGITIGAKGDFEMEMTIAELGAGYRFLDVPWGADGSSKRISMDLIGGARYWRIESELNLDLSATAGRFGRSRSFSANEAKDWIDPFIGARIQADLTEKLFVWLRGDVGGFGIGSAFSSQFSWKAQAGISYNVTPRFSLFAGYEVLDVDYEDGGFGYDIRMGGPVLGFGYTLGGPSTLPAQKN